MKMRKSSYHIHEQDLLLLITYLKHGYSLQEALPYFPKAYKYMKQPLEMGVAFEQILYQHLPHSLKSDFNLFQSKMPLELALEATIERKAIHKQLLTELRNKSLYPLFLFGLAFILLQVFSRFILPLMLSSFTMIEGSSSLIQYVWFMDIVCNVVVIILFSLFIILLFFMHPFLSKYLLLKGAMFLPIIRTYLSFMLVTCMLPLISNGISTFDIIIHLQTSKTPWMQTIAQQMHRQLLEGDAYEEVFSKLHYFDDDFIQCIHRGIALSNLEDMLILYLKLAKQKLMNAMRNLTIFIQIVAYVFIAFLVLFVFQIMLVPLSILETI